MNEWAIRYLLILGIFAGFYLLKQLILVHLRKNLEAPGGQTPRNIERYERMLWYRDFTLRIYAVFILIDLVFYGLKYFGLL